MQWNRLACLGLALALLGGSLRAAQAQPKPLPQTHPDDQAVLKAGQIYATAVRSKQLFDAFSAGVAGERFIKLFVDLRSKKIIYFDVNTFRMHADFIFRNESLTDERFERFMRNYDRKKPRYLLVYVVHHQNADVWTFNFWEGDKMGVGHVRLAYDFLRKTFFAADRLKFRPDSAAHEKVAAKLKTIPTISNDAIYRQADYQAFTPGKAVGVLRIVREEDASKLTFKPEEILILHVPVPDLTVVSGIISEQFSTPLSHVALRARAWGVPHVGLKKAAERYRALEGKVVVLSADRTKHSLREATADEIAAWKAERQKKRTVVLPKADLSVTKVAGLAELSRASAPAYGAKSANLGAVVRAKLKGFKVPAGLAIPIHFYAAHMKATGLDKEVAALLADQRLAADPTVRKARLAKLRAAIREAPLDAELLDQLAARVKAIGGTRGVFVRSSTNAEDLPGFNGAGLYDSVPNVKGRQALGEAVKQVFASVWNLRAFDERQFYGIDHRAVYAAVLVQVGVDATAAGVLITANMFEPSDTSVYTVNAKSGLGIRVVEGKTIPEQILVTPGSGDVKVISRSDEATMLVFDEAGGVKEVPNPRRGKPVLTRKRAAKLANAARDIHDVFGSVQDIEWLFVKDKLYIVQSRPYVTR